MSGNKEFRQAYPDLAPEYDFPNDQMRAAVDVANGNVSDLICALGTRGGVFGVVAVTPRSPADLHVEAASLEGYSRLGEHLRKATATTVNCAVDYLGAATVPTSGNRWISLFAIYSETKSGSHPYERSVYYDTAVEGVAIQVRKGTATAVAPNPGSGAVRICDVWLTEGIAAILAANIKHAWPAHQDRLGFAVLDTGGTMVGPLYGPQGGVVPQMAFGGGLITHPVSLVPTGAEQWSEYFTNEMEGLSHTRFLINHGFRSPATTVRVALNYPTTMRPVNYLEIHTNYVDAENFLGASTLMTYVVPIHDGAEHYTGQALFVAVGSQAVVTNYACDRWLRWKTICPIYREDTL